MEIGTLTTEVKISQTVKAKKNVFLVTGRRLTFTSNYSIDTIPKGNDMERNITGPQCEALLTKKIVIFLALSGFTAL